VIAPEGEASDVSLRDEKKREPNPEKPQATGVSDLDIGVNLIFYAYFFYDRL
jgi:hypothetical protein